MLDTPSATPGSHTEQVPDPESGDLVPPASSSMAAILAAVRATVREEVAAQVSGMAGGRQATTVALGSPPGLSSTGSSMSAGKEMPSWQII